MISPLPDAAVKDRLAAVLREQITSGDLAPGAKLPSEKALQQTYGLARGTVRQAVAILRAEGLVETRHPVGTFVREELDRTNVSIQRGSRLTVRMPTPTERADLDIGEGVPILSVQYGSRHAIYAGDAHIFTTS